MNIKPTTELDKLLEKMSPDLLDKYYKENSKIIGQDRPFYHYMIRAIKVKPLKDLYIAAGFTESYGGSILRMERHTSNRDTILRLCIAGRLILIETNRALKLYGFNELYSKNPRDACIIVAINNKIFDLYKINGILQDHGFDEIMKDPEE